MLTLDKTSAGDKSGDKPSPPPPQSPPLRREQLKWRVLNWLISHDYIAPVFCIEPVAYMGWEMTLMPLTLTLSCHSPLKWPRMGWAIGSRSLSCGRVTVTLWAWL